MAAAGANAGTAAAGAKEDLGAGVGEGGSRRPRKVRCVVCVTHARGLPLYRGARQLRATAYGGKAGTPPQPLKKGIVKGGGGGGYAPEK